jgi:hypothetical protein
MADAPEDAPGPRSVEEVLADPRLRALLAGYAPLYHESFLQGYAHLLHDLHQHGSHYEWHLEYVLHQHHQPARQYLWLIQHQKLFDLECQWRAGRIHLPGARLTADFEDWHAYIDECPVLAPISPDEVALLSQFLKQATNSRELRLGDPGETYWRLRRRHGLREDADDEDRLWPFTEFWDQHRGTGCLRQLPDPRGDWERRCKSASIAEHQRLHPRPVDPLLHDPRPAVPSRGDEHRDLVRTLLRRCESALTQRQFETKCQLEAYDAAEGHHELGQALDRLRSAGPVRVPIEAHADWRQAIIAAGHRHYLDQVRAALPHAYDDYCQRLALGISPEPPEEYHRQHHERGSAFAHASQYIREGHRLLGEPGELEF